MCISLILLATAAFAKTSGPLLLIFLAISASLSALSTAVYAAQFMIMSILLIAMKLLMLSTSVISISGISVK